MTLYLETERLIVRQFRQSDLESFLAYRNDPEVEKYQGWNIPYSREQAIGFIAYMMTAIPMAGQWLQLAIELKSTNEMIGDVAFCVQRQDERQAVIGYSLTRSHWGHGYAREALSCLLEFVFSDLNLHRVVAECDVENVHSWKLLEKLGFRREAHLVENIFFKGAYGSEYHYAILEREWKERLQPRHGETESAQG